MMLDFHIIAFTHRNLDVSQVGKLHIEADAQEMRLTQLKNHLGMDELMFLSTCNRVEILFCAKEIINDTYLTALFTQLYPELNAADLSQLVGLVQLYRGLDAVDHLLQVASSIDSMVVGEREIITQVRSAFEQCKKYNLTGDFIRLVLRHTIETAKRVYTETSIATKPVSVVALAYHTLRNLAIPLDSRVLMIGAGMTNANMAKFLKKHGFKQFTIFNRTLSKAQVLAQELNGKALPLTDLHNYTEGFDIIITCTGSDQHLITPQIYSQLLQAETQNKVVIDLAIPQDLNPEIGENHSVTHVSIEHLQRISDQNLKERSKEISHVEEILNEALFDFQYIFRMRQVELAMRDVPQKVKEIKSTALNQVFKHEMEALNEESREVLEKIMGYMEKKYMSVPMLMAKEILLKQER